MIIIKRKSRWVHWFINRWINASEQWTARSAGWLLSLFNTTLAQFTSSFCPPTNPLSMFYKQHWGYHIWCLHEFHILLWLCIVLCMSIRFFTLVKSFPFKRLSHLKRMMFACMCLPLCMCVCVMSIAPLAGNELRGGFSSASIIQFK